MNLFSDVDKRLQKLFKTFAKELDDIKRQLAALKLTSTSQPSTSDSHSFSLINDSITSLGQQFFNLQSTVSSLQSKLDNQPISPSHTSSPTSNTTSIPVDYSPSFSDLSSRIDALEKNLSNLSSSLKSLHDSSHQVSHNTSMLDDLTPLASVDLTSLKAEISSNVKDQMSTDFETIFASKFGSNFIQSIKNEIKNSLLLELQPLIRTNNKNKSSELSSDQSNLIDDDSQSINSSPNISFKVSNLEDRFDLFQSTVTEQFEILTKTITSMSNNQSKLQSEFKNLTSNFEALQSTVLTDRDASLIKNDVAELKSLLPDIENKLTNLINFNSNISNKNLHENLESANRSGDFDLVNSEKFNDSINLFKNEFTQRLGKIENISVSLTTFTQDLEDKINVISRKIPKISDNIELSTSLVNEGQLYDRIDLVEAQIRSISSNFDALVVELNKKLDPSTINSLISNLIPRHLAATNIHVSSDTSSSNQNSNTTDLDLLSRLETDVQRLESNLKDLSDQKLDKSDFWLLAKNVPSVSALSSKADQDYVDKCIEEVKKMAVELGGKLDLTKIESERLVKSQIHSFKDEMARKADASELQLLELAKNLKKLKSISSNKSKETIIESFQEPVVTLDSDDAAAQRYSVLQVNPHCLSCARPLFGFPLHRYGVFSPSPTNSRRQSPYDRVDRAFRSPSPTAKRPLTSSGLYHGAFQFQSGSSKAKPLRPATASSVPTIPNPSPQILSREVSSTKGKQHLYKGRNLLSPLHVKSVSPSPNASNHVDGRLYAGVLQDYPNVVQFPPLGNL
ncbi:hypothetical protein RCL1_005826 [Eukaryota sp. TZLM3-RCL]